MGAPRPFVPAKLVISVIAGPRARRAELHERLAALFGPIDAECEAGDFDWTDYYDREMGRPLSRWFVAFERLIGPEGLAAVKLRTNDLERELSDCGRRTVNLDPGLLALSRFTLATTKESAHRIPLQAGIYAELTLKYEKGSFRPLPWTYPDYRSEPCLLLFGSLRRRLREQLRG